jgi:hypothetical protein
MRDFNLDYRKRFDVEYRLKDFFTSFEDILGGRNLVQTVKFPTLSRVVLYVLKVSNLEHIYCSDPCIVDNI